MRRAIVILGLLAATAACAADPTTRPAAPTAPVPTASPSSAPSPPPGQWEVLFDGSSSPALRGYGQPGFPGGSWRVDAGRLRAVPGQPVDLITDATYGDFELEFTWQVSEGGNSGVMYRVLESADPSWASGPEYQILDDERHADGRRPETSAGALYDLIGPGPAKRLRSVGEDNDGRIVVRGGTVEHWLNGELVVTYRWRSPEVEARVALSKFRDLPAFMAADDGAVVFQHHGEAAAFGAIRIRRL